MYFKKYSSVRDLSPILLHSSTMNDTPALQVLDALRDSFKLHGDLRSRKVVIENLNRYFKQFKHSVTVKNLPAHHSTRLVYNIFNKIGPVEFINCFQLNRSGEQTTTAVVMFKTGVSVAKSLRVNNKEVQGRRIEVKSRSRFSTENNDLYPRGDTVVHQFFTQKKYTPSETLCLHRSLAKVNPEDLVKLTKKLHEMDSRRKALKAHDELNALLEKMDISGASDARQLGEDLNSIEIRTASSDEQSCSTDSENLPLMETDPHSGRMVSIFNKYVKSEERNVVKDFPETSEETVFLPPKLPQKQESSA